MKGLLTRDEFREGVFKRDDHKCVICKKPAQDAHHIIERRLWPDGGYYLDNGASLCGACHILAEKTVISVEEIRIAAGVRKIIVPPHLYPDHRYDKWGNHVLTNGQRTKGELFHDESVQIILKEVNHLFTDYVKYPRTYHLPWSPGLTSDDRVIDDCSQFEGKEIVVTRKMDGENTTLYRDHLHARSLDSDNHWSRSWVKQFHATIANDIPEKWRFCGENVYAKHSIKYEGLPSYFLLFSIWNDRNVCLSWDEMHEWVSILGIDTVPVLYRGKWDEQVVKGLYDEKRDYDTHEGYVVRLAGEFSYFDFKKSVAKFVRSNHVQSTHNWKRAATEKNELK